MTSIRSFSLSRPDWPWAVVLAGAGLLLGGVPGLVVALLGVTAGARHGGGRVARAAFVLLVLAAVATTVEAGSVALGVAFVDQRPVAAAAARAAGILALVALVTSARTERAGATTAPPRPELLRRTWDRSQLAVVLPYGLVAAGALVVRMVAATSPLPPGYGPVVASLRAGNGFFTGLHPPLAAVVAAFTPGTARAALVVVSALTVVAVMRLAHRLTGRRPALVAGLVAAVLPSFWGQQLPEALAALAVTTAFAVLWPPALDARRAALGGLALAAAALARPEAVLAVPVAVAWMAANGGRALLRHASTAVAVAVVAFAPWQLTLHRAFDTWLPATSLGPTLLGATEGEVLSGRAMGSFRPTSFSRPGGDEGARQRRAMARALRRSADPRLPLVVTARVLRGWDLWPGQAAERARRGLPFPGSALGVVVEAGAAALTVWGLVRLRPRWRLLLPVFALPVLFTLLSAVTFGDRGLRYLASPGVAVLSGLALAVVRRRAPVSPPVAGQVDEGPAGEEAYARPVLSDGEARVADRLAAEHERLAAESEGLAAERQQLGAERQGLEADRDELEAEREGLAAERQRAEAARVDAERRAGEVSSERQRLDAERHDLDAQRQGLNAEHQRAEAARVDAERRAGEVASERQRLDAERQALEAQRAEVERRASGLDAGLQELASERESLEAGRQQLDAEGQHLRAERQGLEAERQRAEAARVDAERRAGEVASELQRLQAERQALEAQRAEVERRASGLDAGLQELASERESLEAGRQQLDAERQRLEREHQGIDAERDRLWAEIERRMDALDAALQELVTERERLDADRQQLEAEGAEVERRAAELTAARHQLAAEWKHLDAKTVQLGRLVVHLADRQHQVEVERERLAAERQGLEAGRPGEGADYERAPGPVNSPPG